PSTSCMPEKASAAWWCIDRSILPVDDRRPGRRRYILGFGELSGRPHRFQALSEFLGDGLRLGAVANQHRPNENDDLGALLGLGGRPEQIAEIFDLVEARHPRLGRILLLADQPSEQHRLTAGYLDGRVDAPLRS